MKIFILESNYCTIWFSKHRNGGRCLISGLYTNPRGHITIYSCELMTLIFSVCTHKFINLFMYPFRITIIDNYTIRDRRSNSNTTQVSVTSSVCTFGILNTKYPVYDLAELLSPFKESWLIIELFEGCIYIWREFLWNIYEIPYTVFVSFWYLL